MSNNSRISRYETTRFSRFLIELSLKGSGWDGTALDRAPVDELEPDGRRLKVLQVLPLSQEKNLKNPIQFLLGFAWIFPGFQEKTKFGENAISPSLVYQEISSEG